MNSGGRNPAAKSLLARILQPGDNATPSMAGSASILAGAQFAAAALGLLTTVVATRLLGPGEYGLAALAISYPSILWSFTGIKSVSVITRYVARFRAEDRREELLSLCKAGYAIDVATALAALVILLPSVHYVAGSALRAPDLMWLMVYLWCIALA